MRGIIRIERIVAEFNVWLDATFPFAKMKVKVIERKPDDYLAISNLSIRNTHTGMSDPISGLGGSVEEALNDFLPRFIDLVKENTPANGLSEEHFEWSSTDDF